eukprot:TRINITY_DN30811_c0_g1_i1.p1 TRINITY_DN30811_c0_g1~~TRINITY_DN30811_c0_g1_i1.p1  ORF type:complete len:346 (-),score=57.37 TRINITY_DN30811_c0_g1_i1:93-1130(-)
MRAVLHGGADDASRRSKPFSSSSVAELIEQSRRYSDFFVAVGSCNIVSTPNGKLEGAAAFDVKGSDHAKACASAGKSTSALQVACRTALTATCLSQLCVAARHILSALDFGATHYELFERATEAILPLFGLHGASLHAKHPFDHLQLYGFISLIDMGPLIDLASFSVQPENVVPFCLYFIGGSLAWFIRSGLALEVEDGPTNGVSLLSEAVNSDIEMHLVSPTSAAETHALSTLEVDLHTTVVPIEVLPIPTELDPEVSRRFPEALECTVGSDVESLGISFRSFPPGHVVVKDTVPGAWAAANAISLGDQLELCNGQEVVLMTRADFICLMRSRPLQLQFLRHGS